MLRVEQRDVGLHAERDRGRVLAGDAAADDDDVRRAHARARRPSARHGRRPARIRWYAPTCGASRPATSDIGASSGRLRSASSTVSYAMPVTLRSTSASVHSSGRGQVQVGEEGLALAHAVVFLGDRLLDLEDQVGGAPDLVGVAEDLRTRVGELLVGDRRAEAGAGLDEDVVAVARRARARRPA